MGGRGRAKRRKESNKGKKYMLASNVHTIYLPPLHLFSATLIPVIKNECALFRHSTGASLTVHSCVTHRTQWIELASSVLRASMSS